MTDTIQVGPSPTATLVVPEGSLETLVINNGPAIVFFGDDNAIRGGDSTGVVPITANSYFSVTGEQDLFACVATGTSASLSVITGARNFFLPLSSLTIPYGATGQRIVINPPDFPGSIVGYNNAGLVEFIISPNGYLIYDATGGALNHLFIAIQNAGGSDTFANTFVKGIQIGQKTGRQIQLTGGSGTPAVINFAINDVRFNDPQVYCDLLNSGGHDYTVLNVNGPSIPTVNHRDSVSLQLNSPNADASSSANGEFSYVDSNQGYHGYITVDYTGATLIAVGGLLAVAPGTGTSAVNAAVNEVWHSVTPPAGWSGTCRYKLLAESKVAMVDIQCTHAGATGNVTFLTVPAAYRPVSNSVQQIAITSNTAPANNNQRITVNTTGLITTWALPAATTGVFGTLIYPLD